MYAKFSKSKGHCYVYLVREEKTEDGKFKEVIIDNLGTLPEDLRPDQEERIKELIKLAVKATQKRCRQEFYRYSE